MPRYYFDLYNDEVSLDPEGRDLPDREAARAVAIGEARVMMAVGISEGTINLAHRIDVRDDSGVVTSVRFGDAVEMIERTTRGDPRPAPEG